jgi:hypothetical protein
MTEVREVGVIGVVNRPRNNARAVVQKLPNFVLFRSLPSASPREVAGDRLTTAFWRPSRSNESGAGMPAMVRAAIVSNSGSNKAASAFSCASRSSLSAIT